MSEDVKPGAEALKTLRDQIDDGMVMRACLAVYGSSWSFIEAEMVRTALEAGVGARLLELTAYVAALEKLVDPGVARKAYKSLPEAVRYSDYVQTITRPP